MMTRNLVPNWLRIILSILSFLSFLPQLRRIWTRRDSTDISLYYVLFNLISATEQFALGFFYVVSLNQDSDFFVSDPRNAGDWLNLTQLIVVWLMSLVLFAACLFYSPEPSSGRKARVIGIYVAFFLISVVPVFMDALNPEVEEGSKWFGALFLGVHSMLINPIVTICGLLALYVQRQKASALSILGLATQAFVFALVALSWTARVRFIALEDVSLGILNSWYQLVGWAAVDNAVFAIVQFVLFCLAKHYQRGPVESFARPEEAPLLRG